MFSGIGSGQFRRVERATLAVEKKMRANAAARTNVLPRLNNQMRAAAAPAAYGVIQAVSKKKMTRAAAAPATCMVIKQVNELDIPR